VAVQHAAFDSLGLSGVSVRTVVSADSRPITISLPSFATLWKAACGGLPPRDSGFVYGSVRDATGKRPVKGASVDLVWLQIDVGDVHDIKQRTWRSTAQTDSTGTYASCDVPTDIGIRVEARTDSAASGLIDLIPDGSRVRRLNLIVGPTSPADSIHRGTIVGSVTGADGAPLADARIIADALAVVRTNDAGRFAIRDVQSGTRQIEIQSVGRKPVLMTLDITDGDTVSIAAQMKTITTLDVVRVTASARQRRYITEFEERRKTGFGYVKDSTAMAGTYAMTSVLSTFPSVVVQPAGVGRQFSVSLPGMAGQRCPATIWIDGIKQSDAEELGALNPDDLAAVEVYPRAFTVPARFVDTRGGLCGAVIVWTKWAFS
jgi:hypothetical protein